MKTKNIYCVIIVFLSVFLNSFSQSVANKRYFTEFEINLKESNFDQKTQNEILKLIGKRDKAITAINEQYEEQNKNYPITFQDPEFTVKYQNQLLIRSLSKLLTIEQFKKMFLPQLKSQIERITDDRILHFKNKYKFTSEQLSKLKKLCYQNTESEIITKQYYSYDETISKDNYEEEKVKSSKRELELFESFGLFYSQDAKTDALIKNLQKLNVESPQINKILSALQKRKERMIYHDRVWRVNDSTCVIDFYDDGDSQFKIDMELREEISKALKIEEFRTVFEPAFKERISRQALKEFNVTKAAYNLNQNQQDEIYKLIVEKNTEKIITEEYYKFSYYLYEQKLRAVEYRHEKAIREAVQKTTQSIK